MLAREAEEMCDCCCSQKSIRSLFDELPSDAGKRVLFQRTLVYVYGTNNKLKRKEKKRKSWLQEHVTKMTTKYNDHQKPMFIWYLGRKGGLVPQEVLRLTRYIKEAHLH